MWPRAEPAFALAVTAAAGWLWGSFLNQLVDRTPYRAASGAPAAPEPGTAGPARPPGPPPGVGLLRPARSICFGCGRALPWYENVPVASYLWLRGRCRTCGAPIGRRTLVLEVATPLLLLGWHAAWLVLGGSVPVLAWGLAVASWLIVAAGLLAERRQWRPRFVLVGSALVAAAAAALHW
ncbi:MAG TPA: prepilin peptidase [bacterium]|nr:prepilin peptidase [bacterium]